MKVEPLDEETVARIVKGVVVGYLSVWWTFGPDIENRTAATIAATLAENPQDVAGVVMGGGRLIFERAPFIHTANKADIIHQVEEGRSTMLNRGTL